MHELVPVIAAYGVSPIVRIPDLQSWMIKSELGELIKEPKDRETLTLFQECSTLARMG